MMQSLRVSVAALALVTRQLQGRTYWLVRWNEKWSAFALVGGHKHDDESFRDCLIREIREELGVDSELLDVADAPASHLEFTALSDSAQQPTRYTLELFDVRFRDERVLARLDADPAIRWVTESEIRVGRCDDGRAVSRTIKRLLEQSVVGDGTGAATPNAPPNTGNPDTETT